jgi:hypothetical protein
MNATVRYCLKCSAKSTKLVLRTSPKLERERGLARERRESKQQTAAERKIKQTAAAYTWDGMDLRYALYVLCKLECVADVVSTEKLPSFHVRRCSARPRRLGVCWPEESRIQVSVWPGLKWESILETLAHEMAHLVDYRRHPDVWRGSRRDIHGDLFKSVLAEIKAEIVSLSQMSPTARNL